MSMALTGKSLFHKLIQMYRMLLSHPFRAPSPMNSTPFCVIPLTPLSMSDNRNGVDVYCAVRQFVCDTLSQ